MRVAVMSMRSVFASGRVMSMSVCVVGAVVIPPRRVTACFIDSLLVFRCGGVAPYGSVPVSFTLPPPFHEGKDFSTLQDNQPTPPRGCRLLITKNDPLQEGRYLVGPSAEVYALL